MILLGTAEVSKEVIADDPSVLVFTQVLVKLFGHRVGWFRLEMTSQFLVNTSSFFTCCTYIACMIKVYIYICVCICVHTYVLYIYIYIYIKNADLLYKTCFL